MKMTGSAYMNILEIDDVEPGRYRHFKGSEYEVIGTFTHRDTGKKIVAYKGLSNDQMLEWRTLEDFTEIISGVDYSGPRFERLNTSISD